MLLDRSRAELLARTIWQDYLRDLEITPIEEIQDLRSFAILWIALFAPEAISLDLKFEIVRTAEKLREREDYNFVWFRVLPIDAALFVLTGDRKWLSFLLSNIDHHKCSIRTIDMEAVAWIAHLIEFDSDTLSRTVHNLEVRHALCEWPVIILRLSIGDLQWKKNVMKKWLATYTLNADERAVVDCLANGRSVNNPFLYQLLRTQQFLTLQLAAIPGKPGDRSENAIEIWPPSPPIPSTHRFSVSRSENPVHKNFA